MSKGVKLFTERKKKLPSKHGLKSFAASFGGCDLELVTGGHFTVQRFSNVPLKMLQNQFFVILTNF